MAKTNPASQIGDRWDVVFIVKGNEHDQTSAVLESVTLSEAVEFVREHGDRWCCALAIWPSWAYWPDVQENDWRLLEMLEVKYTQALLDVDAKRKKAAKRNEVAA